MSIRDLMPWVRGGTASDPFASLQRDMNRLFDSTLRDIRPPAIFARAFDGGTAWPTLGVSEQDGAYVVTAEIPGMEEKDIEVAVDDGALVIRGEKKAESTDEKTHVSEHFYGRFERRVPVGAEVDRDAVKASFKNGVLTVTLPKSAKAVAAKTRIPITSG